MRAKKEGFQEGRLMARGKKTPPETVEEIRALSVAFDAKAISEKTGVPVRTVQHILRKQDSPIVRQERALWERQMRDAGRANAQEIIEQEIAKLTEKCNMLLEHLTPEKAAKARIGEVATSFGILSDKRRLLQGESTANVAQKVVVKVVHEDGHKEDASFYVGGQAGTPGEDQEQKDSEGAESDQEKPIDSKSDGTQEEAQEEGGVQNLGEGQVNEDSQESYVEG